MMTPELKLKAKALAGELAGTDGEAIILDLLEVIDEQKWTWLDVVDRLRICQQNAAELVEASRRAAAAHDYLTQRELDEAMDYVEIALRCYRGMYV